MSTDNPATVQSELSHGQRRSWYMYCPRCRGVGPGHPRFRQAQADRDEHRCPGRKSHDSEEEHRT